MSRSIFLIAQTPRAGLGNHNFVVPPDLPISIKEVQERINTAIFQPEGKDYIAVSQIVEQVADGRQGREILMLVGLDVEQLSDEQREAVRAKLKDDLSEFAILVTQTIDWKKTGGDFVERRELLHWGQDDVFFRLPQFVKTPVTQNGNDAISSKSSSAQFFLKTGGLVIVAVLLVVGVVKQCTNEERQGVVDKNLYHKYNRFLPEDCSISDENKKVFAEIKTLCGVSTEVYSPDFFKELRENDCHDKLLELSDEVTFLEFLTENNRRKLGDLKLDSKSRRRLRKLHNALLTEPYDETVCLPFLTDEDAKLASELDKKLGEIEDGSLTLKSCLERGCTQKEVEQKLQQQTLDSFIKKWQAVFGSKNQDSAKRELEKLDYGKLKQLESQYRLKMSSLVAFISDDETKKLIYLQLGFDKDYPFDQIKLKKVVAIRNALRKLYAALKGNKTEPEPVYLPLFSDEDARIISTLQDRLKKVKIVESDNLLAGLRQISQLAQDVEQLDNYGVREKWDVTQKWKLDENLTDQQIKAQLSQQLDKFSDSKNFRQQIIDAVRGF